MHARTKGDEERRKTWKSFRAPSHFHPCGSTESQKLGGRDWAWEHNILAVQAFQGTLLEAAALGLWNSVVTIRKDKPTFEKLDQHTAPQGNRRQ